MAAAESKRWIPHDAYNAALTSRTEIDHSQLKSVLTSITRGGQSSILHLAASVGNHALVKQILQQTLQPEPLLVKATNGQGNTALHLAAQGGYSEVVHTLLESRDCAVNVCNNKNETPLFKAYETGNLATVQELFEAKGEEGMFLSLRQKTKDERSCLYVAVSRGDSSLADHILGLKIVKELIQEKYKNGDSILHMAVRRNDVDLIRKLLDIEQELCYRVNDNDETPLCVAAKLGHLEAVQELIKLGPDAVEIPNSCGMNVLHLAAHVSQARIVDYLNKNVSLSELVNRGIEKNPPQETPHQSGENGVEKKPPQETPTQSEGERGVEKNPPQETPTQSGGERGVEKNPPQEMPTQIGAEKDWPDKKDVSADINEGDTPLHIAARNKSFTMVSSLLGIRGINKFAVNKEGLTALDIVRENTEYYESDKIISVLASYPPKRKPFLYNAPTVSAKKHASAVKMVDKTFEERRNTELIVAVLLATMSFTAAFTVPGGFKEGEGYPILLGLDTFKLFLIFDCVAFFLSLFVVLMWQMSTPITTGDKVLFLCVTNLLVCATFAFTAYGFMLAIYAMLANKSETFGWVVLGSCIFICTCANFTFFYMVGKFSVTKARFNHLNGLLPYFTDRVGEWMWMKLERHGPLDSLRGWKSKGRNFFLNCECTTKDKSNPEDQV